MAEKAIIMDARDSVAVAVTDLPAGEMCNVRVDEEVHSYKILEPIPFGHKFAIRAVAKGEDVIKYGEVIGAATADIVPGAWVHVHNLVSKRAKERVREGTAA